MFLGGLPKTSAEQLSSLLGEVDCRRIFVACSGSFRLERTILHKVPGAQVIGNDVSLFSCSIGRWLAGKSVEYRFTGPLAVLEEALTGADALHRTAGVALALELTQFGKGKSNLYKDAHWRSLTADLQQKLDVGAAKLAAAFGEQRLADFREGDWLDHVEEAIAEGATIATFPPFYKGGYENLYRWLDQHTEWARPAYKVFDPKDLQKVVDRITGSGSDYILVTNQRLQRPEPKALFIAQNRTEHWAYTNGTQSRFAKAKTGGKPFAYKPLDLSKVTKDSKVEIVRTDGPRAMYIRTIFLKKTIAPAAGVHNYFVYIDGMLVGCMVYAPAKFAPRPHSMYLLSDVSVSREAKVSKLIARLAANQAILGEMAARTLSRVEYVVTTAFSDHPVSMKYRGVFELLSRKDPPAGETGHVLQYGCEVRRETPAEAFSWWWSTYVKPEPQSGRVGGRGRNQR